MLAPLASLAFGDMDAALSRAAARRQPVRAVTDAYRLVDDEADGFPGITVDCYGEWAVLSVYASTAADSVEPLAAALVRSFARGVYVKHHARGDLRRQHRTQLAPKEPIAGEAAPEELMVTEGSGRFGVSLGDGLSTGLFTDQRDNRRLIRGHAAGARMLNLFSYTCSFSVAAALGGALETVSIDLSNRALARGRENLAHNGIVSAAHRFIREDALAFVARAVRRGERYDIVVLDPPSFGTRGKRTFSVERDYAGLARGAIELLSPAGRLLAVTNHRKTTRAKFRELLTCAARDAGRHSPVMTELETPPDYRHRPDGAPSTKSVLLTVDGTQGTPR